MNAIVEEKQVETCFSLLSIQTKCCSTRKNEFFSHLCSSGTCQPISTSDSSTRLSAPQRHETHHIDLMSPMPSKIPYTTCEPNKLLLNEWMLVLPQFISEEAKNQRDYKWFSGNHTAGQSWEINMNSAPGESSLFLLYHASIRVLMTINKIVQGKYLVL